MELSLAIGRWDLFILVLVRVSAVLGVAPVLSSRSIPVQIKVGLSVLLALLISPLHAEQVAPMLDWATLGSAVAREVVIGLMMGFAGALVFSAIQVATRLIGVQVGVSMAGTMDPLWSEGGSFVESFYGMLAAVIFLTIGGHHAVISAIGSSFDVVPLGQFVSTAVTADRMIGISAAALAAGMNLAMPVVGAIFLTDIAMAVLVRSIPQINIFAVSMPLKMIVGLLAMAGLMPLTSGGIAELSRGVGASVLGVLR